MSYLEDTSVLVDESSSVPKNAVNGAFSSLRGAITDCLPDPTAVVLSKSIGALPVETTDLENFRRTDFFPPKQTFASFARRTSQRRVHDPVIQQDMERTVVKGQGTARQLLKEISGL